MVGVWDRILTGKAPSKTFREKAVPTTAIAELRAELGTQNVLTELTDRLARAHDASIYRLVPEFVARPRNIKDVETLFRFCHTHQTSLTFRAAGTSLSGQSVTEGILAELGPHFRKTKVRDNGALITSEPGVTGGLLNSILSQYQRRIGPDPASLASAMVGGIVANNASGMCCGTHDNAYQTLHSMKVVLASGDTLDTANPNADEELQKTHPKIYQGLLDLRERILSNPKLLAKVRKKYGIKNTMGYSLNSFVDFEKPAQILSHLMVGSEGTLGFIAEVTLKTVDEHPFQSTSVAYFADIHDACAAVDFLAASGATVLEIMDYSSLQALKTEMQYPFDLPLQSAALLIEFHELDAVKLSEKVAGCLAAISPQKLLAPIQFTEDADERARYWKLRKGLFPKVGAQRKPGTAVIIEDICIPRQKLPDAVRDLRVLFKTYGFEDAVIFGHAKEGNLHFVVCNDFSKTAEVTRYAGFMDALANLVVNRYDGSLKAEHGTGRNMAPFVRMEWGDELYQIMREVKELLDPNGILNPGVLLTQDSRAHLNHLKSLPMVSSRVDQCIECGFCEKVCPSQNLSLTPRQRIALQREQAFFKNLRDPESRSIQKKLEKEFEYSGIKTCAGDGLCASVCPVGIDTGAFMRELNSENHSRFAISLSLLAAQNVGILVWGARWGLRFANFFKRVFGTLPFFPKQIPLPRAALTQKRFAPSPSRSKVVYFSACLSKVMGGASENTVTSPNALIQTLEECGYDVIPASEKTFCCGQAFLSKAYFSAAQKAAEDLIEVLWKSSNGGEHPIVCDTSPCTSRLWTLEKEITHAHKDFWKKLKIFDFPSFMATQVIPQREKWPQLNRHLVLHPTCSSIKHGTVKDLVKVAKTFAREVTLPKTFGCCGFAGDKGFRVPELTLSATRQEGEEVRAFLNSPSENKKEIFAYSTCQTCSLGMEAATGMEYQSIAYLCLDALQESNPDTNLT